MTENTHQRWWHVDALFSQALDLPTDQHTTFLDEACQGDTALRREVETLLKAHHDAQDQDLLGQPLLGQPMPLLPPDLEHPSADRPDPPSHTDRPIGAYRLLGQIGRGGMGSVYLAERNDGHFRQRVALKLLRRSALSPEAIDRFRLERQILARLEHPGIALLLDGGVTDEGLPYLVMQYVDGQPIDQYCDEHRLSIEERLKLFLQVCQAVQYAHQSLVVHRDLKPSNILVTAKGQVKLLDFGIAKVLGDSALEGASVVETQTGRGLMTPAYASPEQVRGEAITTASDVYALGVLLYELLTGRRPYRVSGWARHEVERVILEQEPARLSVAVRAEADPGHNGNGQATSVEAISQARSTRPERLERRLLGDLDNIVLKALEKESSRRYGSAEQLAEDLSRHLSGLPVKARAGTLGYRAKKFVGRHRLSVAVAAFVAVLLLGFSIITQIQAQHVAEERDKAEGVVDFMVDLFKISDPRQAQGETVTAQMLLDAGSERLAEDFGEQPDVQGKMMDMMSEIYRNLGLLEQAQRLGEEGLAVRRGIYGDAHMEVAQSLNTLGLVLRERGKFAESEALHQEALSMQRELLPAGHADLVPSLNGLGRTLRQKGDYPTAEALHREALGIQRRLLGDEHPDVAWNLNNLGVVTAMQGEYARAETYFREALSVQRRLLGDGHPDLGRSLNNLATVRRDQGDYAGAEPLYWEALALRRKVFGNEHPSVARSLAVLATLQSFMSNYAASDSLWREVLSLQQKIFGAEHPEVAETITNLAWVLQTRGNYEEAERLYRDALAMRRKLLGTEHRHVAQTMSYLAKVLGSLGEYSEAEALYHEALDIQYAVFGDEHDEIAWTLGSIAWLRSEQGNYEGADSLYHMALAMQRKSLGNEHPDVANSLDGLAWLQAYQDAWEQADSLFRMALAIRRPKASGENLEVTRSLFNLAWIEDQQGNYDDAEAQHREVLALRRKLIGNESWGVAQSLSQLGGVLNSKGDYAEAEPLFREALALRRKLLGDNHWRTLSTQTQFGICLTRLGHYEEAEALLVQAYTLREHVPENRKSQRTLEALVELYEAWGKPEQAASYHVLLTE